jgi:hypothetical protein
MGPTPLVWRGKIPLVLAAVSHVASHLVTLDFLLGPTLSRQAWRGDGSHRSRWKVTESLHSGFAVTKPIARRSQAVGTLAVEASMGKREISWEVTNTGRRTLC